MPEQSTTFESATTVERAGEGRYSWSVPDGWQQGRGAWGGLVVAAIVRAAQAEEPDASRHVRTVSVQITSPALVGVHEVAVRAVRVGGAMSTWGVSVATDAGEAVAQGVVICGSARATDGFDHATWAAVSAPAAPAPDAAARVPGGPPFPTFTQHLHMEPLAGLPMSGGSAETMGWIGYDQPLRPDAAALLALVDGWYPASLPVLDRLPRIATVNFTANLLVDPASVTPGELLLSQSFVSAASEGFTSEHRRLWTRDGRLAVDNLQTIVVGA